MNIVLDTNIIVSSLCFPFSKPRIVFDIARKHFTLLSSKDTLKELEGVLHRDKFNKYIDIGLRKEFLTRYSDITNIVFINKKIELCRDPKDNIFLELALCGKADLLITGDNDLLVLKHINSTKIITIEDFLSNL